VSDNERVLNIEGMAVSAVTDILAVCPALNDQITVNDKTPITDGHIDLYESDKHANTNLIGRVAVQVKGRTAPAKVKKSADSVTFSIERTTLEFFRNHGGGLYFYVPFSAEGKRKGVFYVSMIPWRIDDWLSDMKPGQKSRTVKMTRLPTEPSKVQQIVYIAWASRVQTGAAKVNLEDIRSELESIELVTMTQLSVEQPTTLNLKDTDFVATAMTVSGSRIPLNIELVAYPQGRLPWISDAPIACGGVTYENPTVECIGENAWRVTLSEGLSIRAFQESAGLRTNIDLVAAGTLFDQVKAMNFFLAAADGAPLVIDGREMAPSPSGLPDKAELAMVRERVQEMVAVLESFQLGDAYARSLKITAEDKRNLLLLHTALVLEEELPITTDGLGRMKLSIGGGHVSVLVTEGSDGNHRKVVDPFSPNLRGHFVLKSTGQGDDEDPDAQWVTIYEALTKEELASTLNLYPDTMSDAYEALPNRETALSQANQMVLNLLSAADESEEHRAQYLLRGAKNLGDWLVSRAPESLTHRINQWQTWHRLGLMSREGDQQIRQARRELPGSAAPDAALQEVCLAILLHDQGELEFLMNDLPADDRARLMSWPIWKLAEISPESS